MKRALVAALLSGLILPGLGQLYNRRPLKAAAFILVMSGFLVALSLALFFKLGQAAASLSEAEAQAGRLADLSRAFGQLDLTWLTALLVVMGLVWLLGVVDAFRDGRRAGAEGGR
jgi:TM2 domain-containing membrane protein YozV